MIRDDEIYAIIIVWYYLPQLVVRNKSNPRTNEHLGRNTLYQPILPD